MAASTDQNFELAIGEDRVLTFTVTSDGTTPVDITNNTPTWRMTVHPLSAAAATLSVTGVLTDGPNGVFTVTLDDTDTDSLNPGIYYHEAKTTDASGIETIVSRGRVNLVPSQT